MKLFFLSLIFLSASILSLNAQPPTEIWGVTRRGGTGFGAVFKMDNNGNNPFLVHSFDGKISAQTSMIQFHEGGNGKLYAAVDGGMYDEGVIIELDPKTGNIIEKAYFNSIVNGDSPQGMTLGPNGKFYGTMGNHHTPDKLESIFEYDITSNIILKKARFRQYAAKYADSDMLLTKSGKLFGTTKGGGVNNHGTLYQYDIASDSIIQKIDFVSFKNGISPSGGLVECNNKLYGCTLYGGIINAGTIFEYDMSTNSLITKYKMEAVYSTAGLTLGNDGFLYGATHSQGVSAPGVFFKFDPVSSAFTSIINLEAPTTGINPAGRIKKCKNGLLYGMLADGGLYGGGNIFEYDPVTSKFKIVFSFKDTISGMKPLSAFEQAQNGKLYGGTVQGGTYAAGVIFEFDIVYHSYKKIVDQRDGKNGYDPTGSLSLADNGKIYSVTPFGGQYSFGVLLECDPSTQPSVFTKKHDFNKASGVYPIYAPVQGPGGKLYGTTLLGGKGGFGTLYEYDPVNNSMVTRVDFSDSITNGFRPTGITLASNNKLYGVTMDGKDLNNTNALFEFDPVTGVYSELVELENTYLIGELLLAKNGKLYALFQTSDNQKGELVEYTPGSDSIIVKAEFEHTDYDTGGSGKLAEGANGKLYGRITPMRQNEAYIFEYDISTELFQKKFIFDTKDNGVDPIGSLLAASNGNLYGMTNTGGSDNRGVVYEYNYTTNVYTKKFDFRGPFGMNPVDNNNLIEVCKSIPYQGTSATTFACETKDLILLTGLDKANFTFQWYKDQVLLPSATSEKLILNNVIPGDAGVYFCKVSNGCRTIQTAEIMVKVLPVSDPDCIVGVEEQEKVIFEIYPNPVKDQFWIRVHQAVNNRITVELTDVLGKLVLQETVTLSDHTAILNVEHLENGIYGIRIRDDANTIFENRKLIKQ